MRDTNGTLLSLGDEVVMCVNNYPYRGIIVAMNAHVTIETKWNSDVIRKSARSNRVIKIN